MVVVGSESQVFQNISAYMSNWVHHLLQSFGGADSLKMKLPPTRWAQKPAIHGVKWDLGFRHVEAIKHRNLQCFDLIFS